MKRRPWSSEDRQRFADGVRDRASTVPGRRPEGPTDDEWDDEQPTPPWSSEDRQRARTFTASGEEKLTALQRALKLLAADPVSERQYFVARELLERVQRLLSEEVGE